MFSLSSSHKVFAKVSIVETSSNCRVQLACTVHIFVHKFSLQRKKSYHRVPFKSESTRKRRTTSAHNLTQWPNSLFKVPGLFEWIVIASQPALIDDIRKAPEHVLSAHLAIEEVSSLYACASVHRLIPSVSTSPSHAWNSYQRESLPRTHNTGTANKIIA